jgi:taurine--2-oxoglutarate transaminase
VVGEYFKDHFLAVGHTFAYHTVSMAALKAAINVYREERLIENADRMGRYLGKRLMELMDRHESIGDVRGLGLFWAVELVKDRESKMPFNTREDKLSGRPLMTSRIARRMMERGVLLSLTWLSHFVIAPPLIVGEEDIDLGVDALDEALKIADEEVVS